MSVPRSFGNRFLPLGLVAVLLVLPAAGVGAYGISSLHATPALFHTKGTATTAQSTNWAGWAITAKTGTVSDVKGSWIVPRIHGTCPSSYQYSSFWIGIDGYSSSTVEQIGTDSDCQGGSPTYYAWFEFYPNPSRLISTVPVSPGNIISADVHFTGTKFTVTLKNLNSSKSFSRNSTIKGARSSAEWIAEAPSSSNGVLPLANFGKAMFGADTTGVTGTGAATISGTTGAIGAFTTTVQITMIKTSGTGTKASTSSLTPDGSSFNVTWKSVGP